MTKNTLRNLHKELKVKQTLKIYINNTNRKYKRNWTADEELTDLVYLVVKLNTQGKLRQHQDQLELLNDLVFNSNQSKALETKLNVQKTLTERERKRADQAVNIVNKDNLKNAYIETLKEFSYFLSSFNIEDRTNKFLSNAGIKYAKFINREGVLEIFQDRIKWFESELKK